MYVSTLILKYLHLRIMKKYLLYLFSLSMAFISCDKEDAENAVNSGNPNPVFGACFTYSIDGGIVSFNADCSVDGESYEWDFGDNQSSQEMNPTHEYVLAGDYEVELIITGNDGATSSSKQSFNLEEFCKTCTCSLNGQSQTSEFCGVRQAADRFCDACNSNNTQVNCNCP
jgi:hypothetical protein